MADRMRGSSGGWPVLLLAVLVGFWAGRWYGRTAGLGAALVQLTSAWVIIYARKAEVDAQEMASRAEETLNAAEAARADTQTREASARGERSEAEGEANALRAEAGALPSLVLSPATAICTSFGMSTSTGPGRPVVAMRNASSMMEESSAGSFTR